MQIDFWECVEGEITTSSKCEKCEIGKYTFEKDSEFCLECI